MPRLNLIATIRRERIRRANAGENDKLGPSIRAVCEPLNLCPNCKLGRGRVYAGYNSSKLCPLCHGAGKWTPQAAAYRLSDSYE